MQLRSTNPTILGVTLYRLVNGMSPFYTHWQCSYRRARPTCQRHTAVSTTRWLRCTWSGPHRPTSPRCACCLATRDTRSRKLSVNNSNHDNSTESVSTRGRLALFRQSNNISYWSPKT